MKKTIIIILCVIGFIVLSCSGSSKSLKLGNCPLTVIVKAEGTAFDGYANIYINKKLIGTTDNTNGQLKISLKKGEYTIWVLAEGYEPWKRMITLLGNGYKQNVLASLKIKKSAEKQKENKED